jgi:predicted DNA-binding protein (MmcQ/YjbR family)
VSLFAATAFERYARSLPAVTLVDQWESHVAKVGGKVFALISLDGTRLCFKVSETSFEGLTSLDGVAQAAYFAKRQWVVVEQGAALSDAELRAYVAASHALIAAKLTKKLRVELGLVD